MHFIVYAIGLANNSEKIGVVAGETPEKAAEKLGRKICLSAGSPGAREYHLTDENGKFGDVLATGRLWMKELPELASPDDLKKYKKE